MIMSLPKEICCWSWEKLCSTTDINLEPRERICRSSFKSCRRQSSPLTGLTLNVSKQAKCQPKGSWTCLHLWYAGSLCLHNTALTLLLVGILWNLLPVSWQCPMLSAGTYSGCKLADHGTSQVFQSIIRERSSKRPWRRTILILKHTITWKSLLLWWRKDF